MYSQFLLKEDNHNNAQTVYIMVLVRFNGIDSQYHGRYHCMDGILSITTRKTTSHIGVSNPILITLCTCARSKVISLSFVVTSFSVAVAVEKQWRFFVDNLMLGVQMTPANKSINKDGGYELPGCWITTMKKLGVGSTPAVLALSALVLWPLHQTQTACARKLRSHAFKLPSFLHLASLFALRMTRASSRNVSNLYTEH